MGVDIPKHIGNLLCCLTALAFQTVGKDFDCSKSISDDHAGTVSREFCPRQVKAIIGMKPADISIRKIDDQIVPCRFAGRSPERQLLVFPDEGNAFAVRTLKNKFPEFAVHELSAPQDRIMARSPTEIRLLKTGVDDPGFRAVPSHRKGSVAEVG